MHTSSSVIRPPGALVALLLVALAATLLPAVAAEASAIPTIRDVGPVDGSVVTDATPAMSATVSSGADLRAVALSLDGTELPVEVEVVDARRWVVRATAPALGAGEHVVALQVDDAESRRVVRTWRFAVSTLRTGRLHGPGRIETAIAISRDHVAGGAADGAVLARADGFADALAGAPLASLLAGPLLLTTSDDLHPAVADELRRTVRAGGVVHLLGGTAALAPAVADAVAELGFEVVRHAGADRYDTALSVAAELARLRAGDAHYLVVASGERFPDALTAAAPAARDGAAIVLTSRDQLPDGAVDRIQRAQRVVIVGGTAVVSAEVEQAIRDLGVPVERVAGPGRHETAAAVAMRFFPAADRVGIANGDDFPDALAGSVHAARRGGPLLLTTRDVLPPAMARRLGAFGPTRVTVYGGAGAVADAVIEQARWAATSGEGPQPLTVTPASGTEVGTLDTVEVELHRQADLAASTVTVTLDGYEVPGRVTGGDFTRTLVFHVRELPFRPRVGQPYEVRIVVAARDERGTAHHETRLTYRKQAMSRGDAGSDVAALQHRLVELGYWLGDADGTYGALTHQAVMAFEKVEGLPADGVADAAVRDRLAVAGRAIPRSGSGRWVEVDKTRQVLLLVRDGRVEWALNTSTGTEQPYEHEGETYIASTPTGQYQVSRQIDGMRESHLGQLWRPKYFNGGIAVHGSTSVPNYPASHGCVRLTYEAMDWVWESGQMPIGTRVWVYGVSPGEG